MVCKVPTRVVITVVLLVLLSSADGVNKSGRIVGSRQAVRDVKRNEEVQGLGEFSVAAGNRSGKLVFLEVVEAQVQVVSGLKYFMKVKARGEDGEVQLYDSVVLRRPWLSHASAKKLISFSPSPKEHPPHHYMFST